MKKALRYVGLALAGLVLLAGAAAGYVQVRGIPSYPVRKIDLKVEVTPERVARGRKIAETLCADCHRDPATGVLTGKLMPDLPAQFGKAYAKNITQDRAHGIGAWTDGQLAYLLRTGILPDGRYAPPWMVKLAHLADEELYDIIAFLRSDDPMVRAAAVADRESEPSFLAKFLCYVAFKPFPYPDAPIAMPNVSDKVAFGRYLATAKYDCYPCHSADFATVDYGTPEKSAGFFGGGNAMPDLNGNIVYTTNITPHEKTGIGSWTAEQFDRALRRGVRPDNTVLRYPMSPYALLDDAEVAALYAYLRTVPPIDNPRRVTELTAAAAGASAGKHAYYAYGCNTCHGDSGIGLYDLRRASSKYPTDPELIAFIRNPERVQPGIKMPTWDGVIDEGDYELLARYVRELGGS